MTRLACALALAFLACAESGGLDPDSPPTDGKSDSTGFARQPTLHFGQPLGAEMGVVRHWHEFYAAATGEAPIEVQFSAANSDGSIRLVVFGPLVDGERERVGHAGTNDESGAVTLDATLTDTGKYVVVVARHADDDGEAGRYQLAIRCTGGQCDKTDAITSHRAGGVAGLVDNRSSGGTVTFALNDGLEDAVITVSRTPRFGAAEPIAELVANGGVATFELPDDLADGSDITVAVSSTDDGVPLRVWRDPRLGIALDSVTISDFSNRIGVGGVGVFHEGSMWLVLGSEDRGVLLAEKTVHADLPGQPGLGFGAFDASFDIPIFDDDGNLDPELAELIPRDDEVLQIAVVSEEPSLTPVGCFRFCNNLADDGGCVDIEALECTDGAIPLPAF